MTNSTSSTLESSSISIVSTPRLSLVPGQFENPSIQITFHKLNGSNFREWYQSVLLVIKRRGKMGYLIGATVAPPLDSNTYSVWEVKNSIVMLWLINSMEQRIGHLYLFYETTKEVWDTVQEMYSNLEDISQSFEIRSRIRNTWQGTLSITKYFNTLSELWYQIDLFHNIEWKCSDDRVQYNKMVERDWIFDFL